MPLHHRAQLRGRFSGLWAFWGLALCLASFLALGCSDESSRAGPAPPCESEECRRAAPTSRVGVGAGGGGAGVGSGAAGAAGDGGIGTVAPGVLAGTIAEVVEPDLRLGPFPSGSDLLVRLPSVQGGSVLETSVTDEGTYRLEGVDALSGQWVAVGPFDSDEPYVDTLQAANGAGGAMLQLRILSRNLLEEMVRDFFLTQPLEVLPGRAYAVITITDTDGTPVPGAVLGPLPSSDSAVAYDAGDIYSDSVDETSLRGAAMLANVPAVDYPGELVSLDVQIEGTVYPLQLQMAAGSFTLATLEVSL